MNNINDFAVIGIEIRTTNKNGQSAHDLERLWQQFYDENVSYKIANKNSDDIYSIYTDYDSDYTGAYTCIIGLRVESLDEIPVGLVGREIKGKRYKRFIAKGKMPGALLSVWQNIWEKDEELNRAYTADFEVYGNKSNEGADSEVDIFIALK